MYTLKSRAYDLARMNVARRRRYKPDYKNMRSWSEAFRLHVEEQKRMNDVPLVDALAGALLEDAPAINKLWTQIMGEYDCDGF